MTSRHCGPCCAFVLFAAGCNPYTDYKLNGEFNAGSVDPFNFPPPYRGAGASRSVAGSGNGFTAVRAYAQGSAIQYYLFPFSPSQVVTPGYTAISLANQTGNARSVRSFPLAYVFDPPNTSSPFPDQQQCRAPNGYQYDPRRDDVHYDEQGNIFTALPEATFGQGSLPSWTYYPIVREVVVGSAGEPCQDIKSEGTLLARNDVNVARDGNGNPSPDGRYLAWVLIDPGSGVYRVGQTASTSTGVGIQHWGWYQQFLAAYIDGGYIPVVSGAMQCPSPLSQMSPCLATQRVFIPRTNVIFSCTTNADCSLFPGTAPRSACDTATGLCRTSTACTNDNQCGGAPGSCDTSVGFCRQPAAGVPARLAVNYDVMETVRGDAAYSPICEVFTYNAPTNPATTASLPKDAATILNDPATYGPLQRPTAPAAGTIVPSDVTPPYVFCLQTE